MPTIIQQGSGLTLTVDSEVYDPQTSTVVLTWENTVEVYPTLNGNISVKTDVQGNLSFTMYQDWDVVGSLCDALWAAADTGTSVPCSLAASGATFTFDAVPNFPPVGGDANGALASELTMVIDGDVTKA